MAKDESGTILVVEDDAELRFILSVHLRSAGFEVIEAMEGQEALNMVSQRHVDLIIMDVGLPGVDGVAATRQLKADPRTATIPVIMLTARSGSGDVVKGLEAGAQEYLFKPFDVAELLARVRTVHRLSTAHKHLDRLNSQLEAEVDAKTRRLQLLYEFMRDLNHADAKENILDLLIRCVERMIGAGRISLFIVDSTGETLVCERGVGIDCLRVPAMKIADISGITGQVFRSGRTFAAKAYGPATWGDRDYARDAFLSTPLMSTSLETRDGVLGVLNVTDKSDDVPFSDEEVGCIRSVADAAAIALDNVTRRMGLQQSVRVLLQTVGLLAEYRDEETTLHLERVTKLARIIAEELGREGPYVAEVTDDFVESLVQAAPMHDIGKVGIPDEILTKPGGLTPEEFQIMKTHTDIGRRVLSKALDPAHPVPLLQMCIDIAYCHHERFDGNGYPRRIRGNQIPLSARIITLVDAYDAMTSRRRYKEAKPHAEAVEAIRQESGRHFDPAIVEAFMRCETLFNQVREQLDESLEPVAASS